MDTENESQTEAGPDIVITQTKEETIELTISQLMEQDLNRKGRPPLCIDCHYFAKSALGQTINHHCLHPRNYKGINLVDGHRVLWSEYCITHREQNRPQYCNVTGDWFKQREELPPLVQYQPPQVTDISARAKARLSKNALDNL
jgi:hypothetical protein